MIGRGWVHFSKILVLELDDSANKLNAPPTDAITQCNASCYINYKSPNIPFHLLYNAHTCNIKFSSANDWRFCISVHKLKGEYGRRQLLVG